MISFTMIHEYGYNIYLRELWIFFPFFGHKCVSLMARHLGRFDFLMTTTCLVDQIGWEGRVMLTHFGMETNGRRTSDTKTYRGHQNTVIHSCRE